MDQAVQALMNYGVLGIVAIVFFTQYFDDRKTTKVMRELQMQHEKDMAVMLNDTRQSVDANSTLLTSTAQIHADMDKTLTSINHSVEELKAQVSKYEKDGTTHRTEVIASINRMGEEIKNLAIKLKEIL